MAPKIMSDADGDTPPCSAIWSLEGAKAWDRAKQEKYGGTQKAQPMVEIFKKIERRTRQKESEKKQNEEIVSTNLKKSWWRRWFCLS
jgi:hypothetical protein